MLLFWSDMNHNSITTENITHLYQDEILSSFQELFRRELSHGQRRKSEELISSTLISLGFQGETEIETEIKNCHFLTDWYQKINNFSYLNKFLKQPDITEIIVHDNCSIQIERIGQLESHPLENLSASDFQLSLEVLSLKNNISWNYASPFASFSIKLSGITMRATLIHFSTSPGEKSKLFLRRINPVIFKLKDFKMEENIQEFITDSIIKKKNMIISGATSSGKTSLLSSIINLIDHQQHVIILEDTHEIHSNSTAHTSMLASPEMEKKSLKDYCAYALRMRPDRMAIGEMRSSEIVPFILAMNNGHRGLLSTIHANSAVDTLTRMALLFSLYSNNREISFELVLKLICNNIDHVIHMKNKKIVQIINILGCEGSTPFFESVFENTG